MSDYYVPKYWADANPDFSGFADASQSSRPVPEKEGNNKSNGFWGKFSKKQQKLKKQLGKQKARANKIIPDHTLHKTAPDTPCSGPAPSCGPY